MKNRKTKEEHIANFKPNYQMGEELQKEFIFKLLNNKYIQEDVIKNVKCFYINDYGMIEQFPINIYGDLNLNDPKVMINFVKIVHKYQKNIVLYRESTVNNHVFNGKMFPYLEFIMKINWNNISGVSIEFKDITADSIYFSQNKNALGQMFSIHESDLINIFDNLY